jgi:nicotinate-nucleotide adenylyltransferase
MKLGLFGGSFDPIHWGHVRPVLRAVDELRLDRVVYLPTGRPPHKPDRKLAPALARYAMAELALLEFDCLHVSDRELSEAAPTYTVDTLQYFASAYQDTELHLLVGADAYAELRSWHRWEDILSIASIAVLARPDTTAVGGAGALAGAVPAGEAAGDAARERPVRVRFVANPTLAVSSTEVRRCLARGERPPSGWVPEPVVDFALKYRLYR